MFGVWQTFPAENVKGPYLKTGSWSAPGEIMASRPACSGGAGQVSAMRWAGREGGSRAHKPPGPQSLARNCSISPSVTSWWRGYHGMLWGMSGISSNFAVTRPLTAL